MTTRAQVDAMIPVFLAALREAVVTVQLFVGRRAGAHP
jgi:hypothetical protein